MPTGVSIKEEQKELAQALLAAGKSYREVARAMDLSIGSVHNISRESSEDIEPLVAQIRGRLAMKHWLLADHILSRITEGNLIRASLKDKALAAAILTDKAMAIEKGIRPALPEMSAMPEKKPTVVFTQRLKKGFDNERK
jgi:hypothetical protein